MNISFWFLWGFSALIGLVVYFYFFQGLADQSVSSSNIGLWLVILFVVTAVLGGSLWLKSAGKPGVAKGVLLILAAPGLLYMLFILVVVIGKPRWN